MSFKGVQHLKVYSACFAVFYYNFVKQIKENEQTDDYTGRTQANTLGRLSKALYLEVKTKGHCTLDR